MTVATPRLVNGAPDKTICTTGKARPLSPEQSNQLMAIRGKIEAATAENHHVDRVGWFIYGDWAGGLSSRDHRIRGVRRRIDASGVIIL